MTDRELATALLDATNWEAIVRAHWAAATDSDEQKAARDLLRHTVQHRIALERFIGTRAIAQLAKTG